VRVFVTCADPAGEPKKHAPAIILALTPHLAAWGKLLIDNSLGAAGTSAEALGAEKLGQVGVLYHGLAVMGGGSILSGLVLGAIGAFVIDRKFMHAAGFALAGGIFTFFGFMHGEAIGVGESPAVTVSYLVVAALLVGCAKLSTAPAETDEEAEPHAVPEPAE
jgi:AGZA family xanthine/uracil permease-like MFS transporter